LSLEDGDGLGGLDDPEVKSMGRFFFILIEFGRIVDNILISFL